MLKNCSSAWEQRPGPQGADGLIMITVSALNAGALEPRQLGLHSRSAPEGTPTPHPLIPLRGRPPLPVLSAPEGTPTPILSDPEGTPTPILSASPSRSPTPLASLRHWGCFCPFPPHIPAPQAQESLTSFKGKSHPYGKSPQCGTFSRFLPGESCFGGRRKAVRDRLALQGGTGDFP